jgi:hypothetical protein
MPSSTLAGKNGSTKIREAQQSLQEPSHECHGEFIAYEESHNNDITGTEPINKRLKYATK